MPVDGRTDKLIRRTAMVGTVTAAYFLLAADYGPTPNALDPIKKAIGLAQLSLRSFVFGSEKEKSLEDKEEPKTKIDSSSK